MPVSVRPRRSTPALVKALINTLVGALAVPWANHVGAAEEVARVALDPIVVVATRLDRPLSEIAAQVTVIEASQLRRQMAEDVDGALRYEPGLEVQRAGTRFGATGVNIRGIGGNRVAIEIDGVPVRDRFEIGAYSNAGRLPVETDRIRRIEVLHGPASVMYGSRALGGVLAIDTWDPSDLTDLSDHALGGSFATAYQGMDDSWSASGMAAWNSGEHGLLAAATTREGQQLENRAPPGTPRDLQDWSSEDYLLRYTWNASGGSRLRLTASRYQREAETDMKSLLGQPPRFRSTTALHGEDRDVAHRLSLDYEFSAAGWESGTLRLFRTGQDTEQLSHEERAAAEIPVTIARQFRYEQDQVGLRTWAFREAMFGTSSHRIGVGAEWLNNEINELRDGSQTRIEDGSTTRFILGETLPVRDFPNSGTDEFGAWLQDEIEFADGRWQLTPALRWDAYHLDPRPDAVWEADNPATQVVDIDENRLTPRLGLLYRPGGGWSLYAQYAEGFRAPPFQDANIGFDLPLFGYRAIPNPDLESETSQAVEFGLRQVGPHHRVAVTVYHSDYDDFIESRVLIGRDPQTGELLFQSRNIDRARIRGVDLRFDQDLGAWSETLEGWTLRLAGYWAGGQNRETGEPLNSIAPPQVVLGLDWFSGDGAWDLGFASTFTATKHARDIDESGGPRFATPGWTTLDFAAGWRPLDRLELRAGLFNLLDERYWRWLDVANLEANDPVIPLLSRPGRSFSLSARIRF